MRAFLSYAIALLIIVVIGLWMASGILVQGGQGEGEGEKTVLEALGLGDNERLQDLMVEFGLASPDQETAEVAGTAPAEAAATAQPEELRSVRIHTFVAEAMPLEVTLRGRTKSSASITARAQTAGTLESRPVNKGDRVEPGDLLCALDQGSRQLRVAQAEAALAQAQQDFDSNQTLRERGVAAANSGRAFAVALAAAKAALEEAQNELARTEIRAETAGIVQDPIADVGDVIGVGGTCATVVALDPMLFVGAIPEARIGLARTGLPASVTTIAGDTVDGTVSFISAVADPGTRSFPFEIEFANPNSTVRDGLTASATVRLGTAMAHLVPQSVLTLDDDGTLGVRTVADGEVQFHPVTIAQDTRQGVWVLGLPARVDVITLGQEYVKAGQMVDARPADGDATS